MQSTRRLLVAAAVWVAASGLTLSVDGARATPPNGAVLSAQQAKLLARDGRPTDFFGGSVALSGETAVVGAYGDSGPAGTDQGSAYIYTRTGTTWTQRQKLTANDAAAKDDFGWSVAIDGDTAIVSAVFDDGAAGTDQGSAYIYTRTGTTWTQRQKLTANDATAADAFGWSVAIDGDTAIVGSYLKDGGAGTDQGSAYIYTRTGTTWTQQQKLTANDAAARDAFGNSVSLDGDTAVIGSPGDEPGVTGQGSAYVFTRTGTTWTQQQKLTADDAGGGDAFGWSVSISGENAAIGAIYDDGTAGPSQGSAYAFTRTDTTWTQQQKLTANDAAANDWFGGSVALDGDTAVAGAVPATSPSHGSAYVFTRTGTTWTQQQKLTASDGAANDYFGTSVALASDTAVIGAYLDDSSAGTDQGSAYVFVPGAFSVSDVRTVEGSGGANAARFTVTRSGTLAHNASVDVATVAGTATAGADYTSTATTLSFTPGIGSLTFSVPVVTDAVREPTETFDAVLSNPQGALIADGTGRARIIDDEVSLAVNNPIITEADSGTKNIVFKITRTGSTASAITFQFATADGTAKAPGDYTAKAGTTTIAAGATFVNVAVVTKGDTAHETNETFTFTISSPTGGATIGTGTGKGTITNND